LRCFAMGCRKQCRGCCGLRVRDVWMQSMYFLVTLSSAYVPTSQINALYDLYVTTHGESWTWQSTDVPRWDFQSNPINPCSTNQQTWQGITCDKTPSICDTLFSLCNIIEISLIKYNLTGSLSSISFTNLTSLQHLTLDTNKLTGHIPTTLSSQLTLLSLSLFQNSLTQSIPSEFFLRLTRLRLFDFSMNS
jgi:Leucine-rich repeat (LRR) protein